MECEDEAAEVHLTEDKGEDLGDGDYAFVASSDWITTEVALENSSLIHGTSADPSKIMSTMRSNLLRNNSGKFVRIRFDKASSSR